MKRVLVATGAVVALSLAFGAGMLVERRPPSATEKKCDHLWNIIASETMKAEGAPARSMRVFLTVSATDAQTATVRAVLKDDPRVASVKYISKEGAYEEFHEMFADEPLMLERVTAESLPASFDVQLRKTSKQEDVIVDWEELSGVDEVKAERVESPEAAQLRKDFMTCFFSPL